VKSCNKWKGRPWGDGPCPKHPPFTINKDDGHRKPAHCDDCEALPFPQPTELVRHVLNYEEFKGTFVEVGASDGIELSNCHFFESEWGWDGICIEANPHTFELLENNRGVVAINCAVAKEDGGTADFCSILGHANGLSGLTSFLSDGDNARIDKEIEDHGGAKEIISIPVRNLGSILRENGITKVDYLSIDCEGADFDILKGIDFEEFNISVISIEHDESLDEWGTPPNYDEPPINAAIELLRSKGYHHVVKCCGDDIFLKEGAETPHGRIKKPLVYS
jgi:FkbM family methyltransferase